MDRRATALQLAPDPRIAWVERPELRTPTARVWAHRFDAHRFCAHIRGGIQCFGEGLEHVLNYRLVPHKGMWRPVGSPYAALVSRRGDEIAMAGMELRLLDFGMQVRGQWIPLLKVAPTIMTASDDTITAGPEQLCYQQHFSGLLSPGVKFNAWLHEKGCGKELRFARAVQTEWFRRLSDAEFFGFRYQAAGELEAGWRLTPPRMYVEKRGGQAEGEYRRDGAHLYALFPRQHLDRLLPGEWVVDPAITQELIPSNADDCYDRDDTNVNVRDAPYNDRDYIGDYSGADLFGGWRFTTVPVPQGSELNSAFIRFFRRTVSGTPANFVFDADDVDNAAGWAEGATTQRPRGTAYVATTANVTWNSFGAANDQYVPAGSGLNILTVCEEVFQRAGWASGNAIRFRAGVEIANNNWITVEDFSNPTTANVATLDVDYIDAGGGGGQAPRSMNQFRKRRTA